MGTRILKRKPPATRPFVPPPKRRKTWEELDREAMALKDQVKELTERLETLQEQKQLGELVADAKVSLLLSNLHQSTTEKEEQDSEIKDSLFEFSGIFLSLNTLDQRVAWYRTRTPQLHTELWSELTPYLEVPTHSKVTTNLLLDLVFFVFSSGLSMVDISRVFLVDGATVTVATLYCWFDSAISSLARWGKEQIYFLLDEEWLANSSKITEGEEFKRYENTLFYFVDGTIIEVEDSSDPLMSQSLRNGKHGCPAIVFFVMVAPSGIVSYLSEQFCEGSAHDKSHFNSDSVCQKLQDFYPSVTTSIFGKDFQWELGGDKAYPHADKPCGWKWRITKTGEHTKDVAEDGKEIKGTKAKKMVKRKKLENVVFDPGFACLHSVVEQTIGRIKSWPIFSSPSFCKNLQHTVNMIIFSVGLNNWLMRKTNTKQI
jgi:hypothetical protein